MEAGRADAGAGTTGGGRGWGGLGLGCGSVSEEQIRGEIADQAIAAAVVLDQRDRGAAEEEMATDDGEVLGFGIRVSGAEHHELIAL